MKRHFSPMPLPWPERRRLMPLRVILPVLSNFTSFFAYSITSGNVSGPLVRPASRK